MINVLIGIFYVALIALTSYLLYYIIKVAIKDAYYELEFKSIESEDENTYNNTDFKEKDE